MNPYQALIAEANKWVGTKEASGRNDGPEVEAFQKAVDGKAAGEPWCMCFVQFCIDNVLAEKELNTEMFTSEHCLTVWNKTPEALRLKDPKPGAIVIWVHEGTTQGHTGIVTKVIDGHFYTIEGNTGDGTAVNREGDGVYAKFRSMEGAGTMKVLGFIDPFGVS